MSKLNLDETLLDAVIDGTNEGLSMTGVKIVPIGASRFSPVARDVSVLVSLYGRQSGSATLNMTQWTATFLAGKMFMEEFAEFTDDTVDAICELGNMTAGRYKEILATTPYGFDAVSLPAIIFGANYNVYHLRGIVTVSVEFMIDEIPLVRRNDKFFTSTIGFMQTSGG